MTTKSSKTSKNLMKPNIKFKLKLDLTKINQAHNGIISSNISEKSGQKSKMAN